MRKFIIVLINVLTRALVLAVSYLAYIGLNIYMYKEPWGDILSHVGAFDSLIIFCGVILSLFAMWVVDRIILKVTGYSSSSISKY